ncbi:MAG: hypothetical protein IPI33_05215 [Dehalococcoidia bacterium]|uniref:hypothetical protein n=1 Tax=Candidatus Amarobacter glycogenicus TaxID=3140699 RepID=UPI001D382603|nr:hypothetical protein [Dehalococcoidia bacterium]MBK6562198.1 hypothetical protein [Dehalococcoidia bacterium]MBK7124606.1 hypothetical protein [Dehalococcoidia bacterium]MBK7328039.1 hypothetical protein [Dehalococcoidia bacterium]MBK7724642.1 hypothetical protein [Dehalococcoidia bacterium]
MSWRVASLIEEGLANLRANAFRSLLLLGICAAGFGGLAFLELRQGMDLTDFARDFREGGAYVAIATVPGGGLSGPRCESLNGQPGVVAAGAWRGTGQSTFPTAPGVLFQAAEVTLGILRVWDTRQALGTGPGLVIGPAMATELGLRPGLIAAFADAEPVRVSGVGDFAQRNPQAARWALSPVAPAETFDECWVEFEPGAYEAGRDSLAAHFAEGSADPAVRPYRRSDEFTRDPAAEWEARPQRRGWVAVSAVAFGFALVAAWFRRSEAGLYLSMGTRRSQMAIMGAAEGWPLVAAGWSLGFSYAIAAQAVWGSEPTREVALHAAATSGSAALLLLAVFPWASAAVARGSIATLLKDR